MSKILKSLILAAFIVLVSSLSFLAGYAAGHWPAAAADVTDQTAPAADLPERFKLFWEAWGWVDREYYDRDSVDSSRVTYGAIRGMLQSLGDPHSYFADPQERSVSETQLQGGFEGIGVFVEMAADGQLRVAGTQAGSPGEEAGLQKGDVITHVDGKSLAGLTIVQAVSMIRGPRGTKVTLTLNRDGVEAPLTVEVTRTEIRVPSVQARVLDQRVGYIAISQFGAQTGPELRAALQGLLGQNPKGLVLDLRGNPGGYLATAIDVASEFLSDGVVLYEERKGGDRQEFRVKRGGVATSIALVVLVDKGSASASEIVAGALQDHQRAQLVGQRSFGKGSMQSVHTLSDGSSLHVTVAHWLTPNARPIDGNGLTPDVAVEVAPDTPASADPVLDRAVQLLLESSG